MKKYFIYTAIILCALFSSCISTKNIVYFQNKNGTSVKVPINEVLSKPYRLQINDILSITIKADDPKLVSIFNPINRDLDNYLGQSLYYSGYTINSQGKIRIPVLGDVDAIGLTTDELRIKIEKQLLENHFKQQANIFVIVKLGGFRYTINGEVMNMGTKVLYQEHVNIMEAIANSGDITITGDRKSVTVIRQTPTGVEMNEIDLTDINAINSPYYYLQPNDYIYVKPIKQKTWGTGKTGIESLSTIITLISLVTTTLVLLQL